MMANYNHAHYLDDCISGILKQTYPNWELNIVDDGSTDHSRKILEKYAKQDSRIRVNFLEKNIGAMKAFQKAYEKCNGELFFGTSADDYLCHPQFFEMAVKSLTKYDAAGFFARTKIVDGETVAPRGVMGEAPREGFLKPKEFLDLFSENKLFVPGSSSIWRKDLVDQVGGYDEELGPQSDYFINHALPALQGIVFKNEVVSIFREFSKSYGNNVTHTNFFHCHALFEKKMRALPLDYAYDFSKFHMWRQHTINLRLVCARQLDLIGMIKLKVDAIENREISSLTPKFRQFLQVFEELSPVILDDLQKEVDMAHKIFNDQTK